MISKADTDQPVAGTRQAVSHASLLIAVVCIGLALWIGLQRGATAPPSTAPTSTATASTTKSSPNAYSPTRVARADVFIHPLCLERSSELRIGAGFWCEEAFADIGIHQHGQGDKPSYSADRPRGESGFPTGYIGYRVGLRWFDDEETAVEKVVLEVYENGGGTGVFARLLVMERRQDGMYRELLRVHGGDRCNDGQTRLISLTPTELIYRTAATPFRLLNPVDTTDWRMQSLFEMLAGSNDALDERPASLMGWQPYSQIAHCAICCEGSVIRRYDIAGETDEVIAVGLAGDSFATATRDETINGCLQQWSAGLAIPDHSNIPIDDWLTELSRLEHLCNPGPGRTTVSH